MPPVQTERPGFTPAARRLGVAAAATIVGGSLLYGAVLLVGLATAPDGQPIRDPWFGLMEGLILPIAPAMVVLMAVLTAWTGNMRSPRGGLATASMAVAAVLTVAVHGWLLSIPRQEASLAFRWPSLPYGIDILAWDVFFALSALLAAPMLHGRALARWAGRLLWLSALLAAAGLAGVPLANMQVRNIGIVGYAVVFPMASLLILRLFLQTPATRR